MNPYYVINISKKENPRTKSCNTASNLIKKQNNLKENLCSTAVGQKQNDCPSRSGHRFDLGIMRNMVS